MGALLVYSIKSGIILSVMFGAYMLLMSRRKCAALRRMTLLSIFVCALVLPFVMTLFSGGERPDFLYATTVEDVPVAELVQSDSIGVYSWIYSAVAWTMMAGMVAVTLYSLSGIAVMLYRCFRGRKVELFGKTVTVVRGEGFSPFSFWGRIYVPEGELSVLSAMVVSHEGSHVAHRHYLDLALGRLVAVVQWWNPLVWLMMREIRAVHEFQADMDVVSSGYDRREYQYMLLERVAGKRIPAFANGLGNSKLKTRIMMMEKENSRIPAYAICLVILPAALASAMFLSAPAVASVFDRLDMVKAFAVSGDNDDYDAGAEKIVVQINNEAPKDEERKPAVMVDGKLIDYETMSSLDPGRIKSIDVVKDSPEYPDGIIYVHLLGEGETQPRVKPTHGMDSVRVIGYGTLKK